MKPLSMFSTLIAPFTRTSLSAPRSDMGCCGCGWPVGIDASERAAVVARTMQEGRADSSQSGGDGRRDDRFLMVID